MSKEQMQYKYKEMFNDVRLSEDRKTKIGEAMSMETVHKRRVSVKRITVLAACMVAVISCVCIAGAQMGKEENKKTVKEMLAEKGDVITDKYSEERIPNKVTPDTKEVTILIDGEQVVWKIDASLYLDENGQVDISAFRDGITDGYQEYYDQLYSDSEVNCCGWLLASERDEEGNVYFEIKSPAIPLNEYAWKVTSYKGKRYLMVPRTVEFDETVYLTECGDEGLGILLPNKIKSDEVVFFDFIYNGEEYAAAVLSDENIEIIKLK